MKVIKTDGRYNFHRQGFHAIVEFNVKVRAQRDEYHQFSKAIQRVFGEAYTMDHTTMRRTYNENYRLSIKSDRKHRRIHLRDEQTATLIMLQMGA